MFQCFPFFTRRISHSLASLFALLAMAATLSSFSVKPSNAQEPQFVPIQPGEAYATRFSGAMPNGDKTVIDPNGVVGSVVDIRRPGFAPEGQHWIDEPQRLPVTAGEVGQVFGIALDDANAPNIYLSATPAFGLHRTPDNSNWMNGMWGPQAGPGTIYKLNKDNGYKPEIFARIMLDGRANSGAALGNIAYDRWNKQLYVSDFETGMIHRLSISDGTDLGHFNHGIQGRTSFTDALSGTPQSLNGVAFDPASRAQIDNCQAGNFTSTPACWNIADFRRRVWGLGVRRDETKDEVRLYYAVWGSQGFGHPDWAAAGEDQRNSVWSVRIASNGAFDVANVRREFFMPAFFTQPEDIKRAGISHPVSDIAFSKCGRQTIMLVSERGGVRNLGLDAENAFATPHEARVIRYELSDKGIWQPVGRYDTGFYDRKNEGVPYFRANSSGGVDFGLGYTPDWSADPAKRNGFVWMAGDALCSPKPSGMCVIPGTGAQNDPSQVHGIQGTPTDIFAQIAPDGAFRDYPNQGPATPANGPKQSYMIDFDINLDETEKIFAPEFERNDATRIGDVEIYQTCAVPSEAGFLVPPYVPWHTRAMTHRRYGSPVHGPRATHRRWGSPVHRSRATHRRWGTPIHTPRATHRRRGTPIHRPRATHRRWGTPIHTPRATHRRRGTPIHGPRATHRRWGTPIHTPRATHRRRGTPVHTPRATHRRRGTPVHTPRATHRRRGTPVHTTRATHRRRGTPVHTTRATHRRRGTPVHTTRATHRRRGTPVHTTRATHRRRGTPVHTTRATHRRRGTPVHTTRATHRRRGTPVHTTRATHRRRGTPVHTTRATHRRRGTPVHTTRATHRRRGTPVHTTRATHRRRGTPVHTTRATHRRRGTPVHTTRATHRRRGTPVHTTRATHRRRGTPVHTTRATHRRRGTPVHTTRATHRRRGTPIRIHTPQASHRRRGSLLPSQPPVLR